MVKQVDKRTQNKSHFAACTVIALMLVGCGGGGGGSSSSTSSVAPTGTVAPPSQPVLSADQKIYEDAELKGGSLTLNWNLPYGGGNLVDGVNYLFSSSSGGLAKSPAVSGALVEWQTFTSLDSALTIPVQGTSRYLVNGQILIRSATAHRKISYAGTAVNVDYLADDGLTAVESAQFQHFVEVPLTGIIDNSPVELQSAIPIDEWVSANNFAATAKWLPGSFYTTRQGQLISDTYTVEDCASVTYSGPTYGSTPNPCATGATLASIFPVALFSGNGHATEFDNATDGQIITVQGVSMWVANLPQALDTANTSAYRTFFALNGNVYAGLLLKNGTALSYQRADGSVVSTSLQLNANAVASISQGLISGVAIPGSDNGIISGVKTIDLFGIGGHAINGALSPQDLRTHYDIPSNLTGAGQTIAIVDAPGSGDFLADLAVFSTAYGLPACTASCFQQIDLSNGAAITGDDWGSEITLDVQMVHAIAPGAKIVLVTAASGSTTDVLAAMNAAASIPGVVAVTMSFGIDMASLSPSLYNAQDLQLLSYQQQGITFFASSGDGGYSSTGPTYPAASPYVTAVGGTRITNVAWSPTQNTDIAWNFSGGGPAYGSMQSWQSTLLGSTLVAGNNGFRAVPDVSAVADYQHSAFAMYYKQRWVMTGGTSASSPLWAGISALLAQQMQNEGRSLTAKVASTTGGFSGLMYQAPLLAGSSPALRYVTSGNNNIVPGYTCIPCVANAGYSDVTGLGTPDVTQLVNAF